MEPRELIPFSDSATGWTTEELWVVLWQRQEILLLSKASISVPGPTEPPVQCNDVFRSTASSFAVKLVFVL